MKRDLKAYTVRQKTGIKWSSKMIAFLALAIIIHTASGSVA